MYRIKLVEEKDIDRLSEVFSKSFSEADKEKPWDIIHSKEYLLYWLKKTARYVFWCFCFARIVLAKQTFYEF